MIAQVFAILLTTWSCDLYDCSDYTYKYYPTMVECNRALEAWKKAPAPLVKGIFYDIWYEKWQTGSCSQK
jgi:hypothetical protein